MVDDLEDRIQRIYISKRGFCKGIFYSIVGIGMDLILKGCSGGGGGGGGSTTSTPTTTDPTTTHPPTTQPPVNHNPIDYTNPITEVTAGELYECLVSASDPDGDPLNFNWNKRPTGMVVDPNTGDDYTWLIQWDNPLEGNHEVEYSLNDGRGGTVTTNYNLNVLSAPITVTGNVKDPLDGQGMAGILVTLTDGQSNTYSDTTGSDGGYSIII